jgi:hypothetical protein
LSLLLLPRQLIFARLSNRNQASKTRNSDVRISRV